MSNPTERYPLTRSYKIVAATFVSVLAMAIVALATNKAEARSLTKVRLHGWVTTNASWYSPGFYGNRFACSGTPGLPTIYRQRTRGTAHRTLPCGTWVWICYRPTAKCVRVQVIDRGPFVRGRGLDLTARTAMDLCRCTRPYTMNGVRYHA